MAPSRGWGHALNTRSSLRAALQLAAVTRLEADVCVHLPSGTPIMRHAATSDHPLETELTLHEWLREVARATRRGRRVDVVKLDFKAPQCLRDALRALVDPGVHHAGDGHGFSSANGGEPAAMAMEDAIEELKQRQDAQAFLECEVYLNADVAGGAVRTEVAREFMETGSAFANWSPFKKVKLSLGWKTEWAVCGMNKYSEEHVEEMRAMCLEWAAHDEITFALRASFVLASWEEIVDALYGPLVRAKKKVALTVWTGWEGVQTSHIEKIEVLCEQRGIELDLDIEKGSKSELLFIRLLEAGRVHAFGL